MDTYVKKLTSAGLSEHEAKIYYSLIKFGDQTASEISKRTSIGRTNVYDYATSLLKQGLISKYEKSKKTIFSAEDPGQLKDIVNQKLRDAKESSMSIVEIMDDLTGFYNASLNKPLLKIYSGSNGYKEIMDKVFLHLTSNDIYIYVKNLDRFALPEPKYRNHFLREQKFTHLYTNKSSMLQEFQKRDTRELRRTTLLDKSTLNIKEDMIIFDDQLIIGNISKDKFFVNLIKHSPLVSFITQLSGALS